MALGGPNEAAIANIVPENVELCLSSTIRFLAANRWLSLNNRYARDVVEILDKDARASRQPDGRHLAQYVCASSILHCTDGWGYLGRSLIALLEGDASTALHLSYYAELRAAMSLLATQGIGVFNHKHCVIDGPNSARVLRGAGTHVFAWDCLTYWAKQKVSGETFSTVVRPHGRSLADWLAPLGGARVVAPQARAWFQKWGMDLMRLAKDREARNHVSYRPYGMNGGRPVPPTEAADAVREIWSVLEPMTTSGFDVLDWQILRLSLEKYFKARFDKEASEDPDRYEALARSIIDGQALAAPIAAARLNFLLRTQAADDAAIFKYSRMLPTSLGPGRYLGVICRAALLLRLATGATMNLFESAGVGKARLEFWREEVGVERGIWAPGAQPTILTDLWLDVSTALSDIATFGEASAAQQNYHYLGSALGHVFCPLGSCERVALWSIAATD
jgi:hypothetical protein